MNTNESKDRTIDDLFDALIECVNGGCWLVDRLVQLHRCDMNGGVCEVRERAYGAFTVAFDY